MTSDVFFICKETSAFARIYLMSQDIKCKLKNLDIGSMELLNDDVICIFLLSNQNADNEET